MRSEHLSNWDDIFIPSAVLSRVLSRGTDFASNSYTVCDQDSDPEFCNYCGNRLKKLGATKPALKQWKVVHSVISCCRIYTYFSHVHASVSFSKKRQSLEEIFFSSLSKQPRISVKGKIGTKLGTERILSKKNDK